MSAEVLPGYRRDPWYSTGALVSLPWPSDPDLKTHLLSHSLGPGVIDWAEGRGDGPGLINPQTGETWQYTPGQKRFLILWYAHDDSGRFIYRRGVKRGAKGTGKDPFGASVCNAELIGPTQLTSDGDGWYGEPHGLALVQIASNSEAQSKDVLRVANAMWSKDARAYYDLDCGETRTIIKGTGSRQEVLTASEASAEGDPATFVFLNETHHMTQTSGGHRVARVVRRNVGKSPAYLQARVLDGTNAHAQGSDSIGERSYEAWQKQVANPALPVDILYDSIEAPPTTDIFNPESLRAGLAAAYADAPWADLERLYGEVLDPETPPADSIRYYLNGLGAAEDAWVDPRKFDALAAAEGVRIGESEQVTIFVDCSKSGDATAVAACRLSDGLCESLGVWQPPAGKAGEGWLAPREEVDAVVRRAMDYYRVEWMGVDPSPAKDDETEANYWMPTIDGWHRDFSRRLKVWATSGAKIGNSVLFDMRIKTLGGAQRNAQFVQAAMQTVTDIEEHGDFSWVLDPAVQLHVHNAKRRPTPWGVSLGKVTRDSKKRVDLAVCFVGARMGRRFVLNSGKVRQRKARRGRAVF
ncbi:MAG: hypothetical protein REI11_19135 [Patulibacter sp.]|nr:hypothetical protein [Patulibacter sp.]